MNLKGFQMVFRPIEMMKYDKSTFNSFLKYDKN